jgi:Clostripain family
VESLVAPQGEPVTFFWRTSIFLFAVTLGATVAASQAPKVANPAEWTVMVFMNGDNDLEPFAVDNFRQMARVGSTDRVNIVVQFDRLSADNHFTTPDWSQTLRFRVTKNMEPIPSEALEDIGEADMGDPQVLQAFVTWARGKFPAKHYMLVIWDHGQGYRDLKEQQLHNVKRQQPASATVQSGQSLRRPGSYRTISEDVTNNHDKLYGSEIQGALKNSLGTDKLDVLGYDACLMGMVETGYSIRSFARIMVASEELEPKPGWNYEYWLAPLVQHPETTPAALGKILVEQYARYYAPGSEVENSATTLSAIDLSKMDEVAKATSVFSEKLISTLASGKVAIQTARDDCQEYAAGSQIYHIDYRHLLESLRNASTSLEIKAEAQQLINLLSSAVIANYAGSDRQGDWGSTGLAIYFPKTLTLYTDDPYAENGYEKSNTFMPVEFVQKERWTDFLHAYWKAIQ